MARTYHLEKFQIQSIRQGSRVLIKYGDRAYRVDLRSGSVQVMTHRGASGRERVNKPHWRSLRADNNGVREILLAKASNAVAEYYHEPSQPQADKALWRRVVSFVNRTAARVPRFWAS